MQDTDIAAARDHQIVGQSGVDTVDYSSAPVRMSAASALTARVAGAAAMAFAVLDNTAKLDFLVI